MEVTRGRPPPRSFWEAGGGCSSSDVQSEWGCRGRGLGPQGRRGAPLEVGRWAESRRDAAAWAPSAPRFPDTLGGAALPALCVTLAPSRPQHLASPLQRGLLGTSGPPLWSGGASAGQIWPLAPPVDPLWMPPALASWGRAPALSCFVQGHLSLPPSALGLLLTVLHQPQCPEACPSQAQAKVPAQRHVAPGGSAAPPHSPLQALCARTLQ